MNAEQRSLLAAQIRNDLIELWSCDPDSCLRYLAKRKQRDDNTSDAQQSDSHEFYTKYFKVKNHPSGVQTSKNT